MTFVKFTFALLILIPVVILMWHIVSRLIGEFTDSVKESADRQREREKALKDVKTKEPMKHGGYGERYRGSHIGYSDDEKKDVPGLKHMIEKRKRRKERRKKKDNEQER